MANNNWHGPSKYHRTLDGFALGREREARQLTQWQFAEECHWSQQFQSQLEGGGESEVPIQIIDTITKVLDKFTEIPTRKPLLTQEL